MSRTKRPGIFFLPALIFLITSLIGCSEGSREGKCFQVLQSPGRGPDVTQLDELRLADRNVVDEWFFSEGGSHPQWHLERTALSDQSLMQLTGEVRIDAERVDYLRIVISSFLTEDPSLEWDSNRGKVKGEAENPNDKFSREYLFRVADNDQWNGNIRSLRLTFRPQDPSTFRILNIQTLRHNFSPETLAELPEKAWKISRRGVQRIGFPGVPGHPVFLDLKPQARGRKLRFRLTLGEHASTPAEFKIVDTASREILFEHVLAPSQTAWSEEFHVDLPGGSSRLELRTTLSEKPNPLIGLPAWGTIRILGPRQDDKRYNVVLICLDTLRADHLSLYGYDRNTSPNIDRWASRRGVVFENAFSSAPWTLPSHISFLSGVDALHTGANYDKPAPKALTYLAEYLRDHGYVTEAITGGVYLDPAFGLDQGFDVFSSWRGPPETELENNGPLAINRLSTNDLEPFFLFFHTYEIHDPYHEREPYFSEIAGQSASRSEPEIVAARPLPTKPEDGFVVRDGFVWKTGASSSWSSLEAQRSQEAIDRYDAGIALTDKMVGAILKKIYRSPSGKKTIVILTADHGEALGERGLAGHGYLDDFNLHVPFIVAGPPETFPPGRVPDQVRLIDLVPTVLDAVGIRQPPELDGVSLLSRISRNKTSATESKPLDVWSYAASTNWGIGLREADSRERYELNNSAWEGAYKQDKFERISLQKRDSQASSSKNSVVEVQRLRSKIVERAKKVMPGLWIHIQNRAKEAIQLKLVSWNIIDSHRLKCIIGPRGLQWTGRGRVSLIVNEGEEYLLQAELVKLELFGVGVSRPGVADWGQRIDLAGLTSPLVRVLGESGWEAPGSTDDSEKIMASLEVWRTSSSSAEENTAVVNKGLKDQLKALGYIN